MFHSFFYTFVDLAHSLKRWLEEDSHDIEKEWYIENSVSHSEPFSCHCERNKISESDRCRCDDSKIKGIEVALSDRMSRFEPVYEKCSDEPTQEKYDTDNEKFLMVDVEHRERNKYEF